MLSNRPYLLRAFHQWIIDSVCTPILVLDANNPRCKVPQDFAEGGEIVFNISPVAVRDLKIMNESIEFKASFSGVIHIISAPINAVLAIYAEENGEGIFFDAEEEDHSTPRGLKLQSIESFGAAETLDPTAAMPLPAVERMKPSLKLVE